MSLILVYFCCLLPWTVLGKDYYTAAVFEHRARSFNTSTEPAVDIITRNLEIYKRVVPLAAEKGADLVVFNEYGLFLHITDRERLKQFTEYIPDPTKGKYNPCTDKKYNTLMLKTVSCLAREHGVYVVANFGDNQPCTDYCSADQIEECQSFCPHDGVKIYNTNVVYDREGNIVAKYHKGHPYFEFMNPPEEHEFVTFKTEFGKFGLFTCFDSIFKEAVMLADNYNIDTVIFPHFWYDDTIPFKSIEYHQAFALENKVNLIAANTHQPRTASLGSGIYSKDAGALVYSYEPDGESKLLITNLGIRGNSKVPELKSIIVVTDDGHYEKTNEDGSKFPEHCLVDKVGPAKTDHTDYRCFSSQTDRQAKVKLEKPSGRIGVCHQDFCCSLVYSAEDMKEDFYLTAYTGSNNVRNYFYWGEETCLLLRCDPFNNKPCVLQSTTSNTVFKSVELKAHFNSKKVYATVTKSKFRLAPKEEWDYSKESHYVTLNYQPDSKVPLLKVGLYGRKYDTDPPFKPYSHDELYYKKY